MTSRRYLLYVAFALLAAHAAVLEWRGDAWPGPILSDLVQLLIGVLVFVACLQARRRSLLFGRLFWKLCADWRVLLDFGQVAIVFVLIYFYFSGLRSQAHSCKSRSVPPFSVEKFARCWTALTTLLSSRRKRCCRVPQRLRACAAFPKPRYLARAKSSVNNGEYFLDRSW
jgi:hypothetical protein